MSTNLKNLDLTRDAREVSIVDKRGEHTGLTFIVRPKTDDEYQRVIRQAQDRFSTGKKVPAKERREINERLFMARIEGWKWEAPASELVGNPEFSRKNLHDVLYEQGEHSAAIRLQIDDAIGAEEDFFDEE